MKFSLLAKIQSFIDSIDAFFIKVFLDHGLITTAVFTLLLTSTITLALLICHRLAGFNITANVLYNKKLTYREKAIYDRPSNKVLAVRMGSHFIFSAILMICLSTLSIVVVSGIIASINLSNNTQFFSLLRSHSLTTAISCSFGVVWGAGLYFSVIRYEISKKEIDSSQRQRIQLEKSFSEMSDIRDIQKEMSAINVKKFNPLQFQDHGKVFLGFNLEDKKNTVSVNTFDKNHILILGQTGSGKGLMIANICRQILDDHLLVIFDPKCDSWLYHVIADAHPKNFYLIDLNVKQPQINPFYKADEEDFLEIMHSAFRMNYSETDADAYRSAERAAVMQVAKSLDENFDIETLYKRLVDISEKLSSEKKGLNIHALLNKVQELKFCQAINTKIGLNLKELVDKPGVIFVRGSLNNEVKVFAQNLILAQLLRFLSRRDKKVHATIVLDEYPTFLNRVNLKSMTTIRDANVNFILAHTSFGDYSNGGLERKDVEPVVVNNTGLKIIYRVQDDYTAQALSRITGRIRIKKSQEEVDLAEKAGMVRQRKVRLTDDYKNFFDGAIFQNLPQGVSVILGQDTPPELNIIQPILVPKHEFNVFKPEVIEEKKQKTVEELLS